MDEHDDASTAPVDERVGEALRAVGAERGFDVHEPHLHGPWVDQQWHGRSLVVRWSGGGAHGPTKGFRYLAVRLSTTARLGHWADVPVPDHEHLDGVPLLLSPESPSPTGIWAEDPGLGAALWAFATEMAAEPIAQHDDTRPWAQLHVRPDGVVWHLRASRVDAARLASAIDLLERVVTYVELDDGALSERLDRAPGVERSRAILGWAVGFAALCVLAIVVLFVASALGVSW